MIIAALVFCLLFAYLSFSNFKLSLYLTIACLPSYLIRFTLFGIPFTLLEAMIIIACLFFLLKYKLAWWKEFTANTFFWPITLVLIISLVAIIISPNQVGGAGIWKAYFLEPILFYILVINTIKSKKDLQNIFWCLGLSALYLSLISFWQFFSGWNMPEAFLKADGSVDRVVSVFGYPNALGLYLSPVIILFTGFLFWSKDKIAIQLLKTVTILFSFTTIILAQSEAAILSVMGIWLLLGLTLKKTRYYVLSLVIILILSFIFIPTVNNYLSEKILLQDYSGFIRRLIWQESFTMIKDNWFWGAGLAGYQTKIIPYHLPKFEIFLYPHNIILNFWSELGLLGLLAFVWIFIKSFWQNTRAYLRSSHNLINLTLALVIVQLLVHGLVDVPYFKNDLSVLFWLVISFYTVNKNINNDGVAELVEGAAL
ncbi:MAG: O-antigen ligase family protein, partial [Candidatus Buchananbacteria bacterium]|nr:O-antigen ligase family protein [Candidatus Buchananbacteria bacterium]